MFILAEPINTFMNFTKKILIIVGGIMVFAFASAARAATEQVSFDVMTGNLNVSGACSSRIVLVVIRRAADSSIWGSSNPNCVKGAYAYSIPVSDADRQGGTFKVQVFDSASADGSIPTNSASGNASQPVVFSAIPLTTDISTATIIIDTSSIATTTDESFLDATLSQFFNIVMDVGDAVQSFTTIFANTVKASLIAAVNIFSKNLTLLPGGSLNVPTGANQMSGNNWLGAGMTDVFIPNTSVATSSKIIITPTSPSSIPLSVTDKVAGAGFHVGVLSPQAQAISFDWLIVQSYVAGDQAQAQTTGGSTSGNSTGVIIPPPDVGTSGDATAADDSSSTVEDILNVASDTTQVASDTTQTSSSTDEGVIEQTPTSTDQ
jgi:hypothetical protein